MKEPICRNCQFWEWEEYCIMKDHSTDAGHECDEIDYFGNKEFKPIK